MILHIGDGKLLPSGEIVAILDYGSFVSTQNGKNWIAELKSKNRLNDIGSGRRGSIVVLSDGCAWLSPISAATLVKRIGVIPEDDGAEEQGQDAMQDCPDNEAIRCGDDIKEPQI